MEQIQKMGLPAIKPINYDAYSNQQSINPFGSGAAHGQMLPVNKQPVTPVAPATQGAQNYYQQLNEVAQLGGQKAQGFQNGLGGTNNPAGHKIFYAA